jgi:hypothetical protein
MNFSPKPLSPMTRKRLANGARQPEGNTTPPVSAVRLLDAALIYSLLMTRIRNKM